MPAADDAELHDLLARLERPLDALATTAELRQTLARVEQLLVREARHGFCSWEAIGAALGISPQAARRRHRASSGSCPPACGGRSD